MEAMCKLAGIYYCVAYKGKAHVDARGLVAPLVDADIQLERHQATVDKRLPSRLCQCAQSHVRLKLLNFAPLAVDQNKASVRDHNWPQHAVSLRYDPVGSTGQR